MRSFRRYSERVTLELGGNSPNVVFSDSSMDAAIKGAVNGIFYGKVRSAVPARACSWKRRSKTSSSPNWLSTAKKIKLGDPLDPKTRLGAIVSQKQMDTVLGYIEAGKKEGATILAGGKRAQREWRPRLLHRTNCLWWRQE